MFLGLATGSSSSALSSEGEVFDAKLLNMLNLVRNAGVGWNVGLSVGGVEGVEKSVENLNKYANIVTVINSWHALFNE